MADVNDLGKGVWNIWQSTIPQHGRKLVQGRHFSRSLKDAQWVWPGRVAFAQTINRQRTESILINGDINIAVIEVIEWKVPVPMVLEVLFPFLGSRYDQNSRLIEPKTVRQHLDGWVCAVLGVWLAEFDADIVGARDSSIVQKRFFCKITPDTGQILGEGGCVCIAL